MAHLHRLILALVAGVLLGLCYSQPANATITAQWVAIWGGTPQINSDPKNDAASACLDAGNKKMAEVNTDIPQNGPWVLNSSSYAAPNTCNWVYSQKYAQNVAAGGSVSQTYCPAHSTLNGTTCGCSSGYSDAGNGTCVQQSPNDAFCASLSGTALYGSWATTVPSVGGIGAQGTFCNSNLGPSNSYSCQASGTITTTGTYPNGTIVGWTTNASYNGSSCSAQPPGTQAPGSVASSGTGACNDPVSCPPPVGYCPGTVNGVTVWVACTNAATTSTSSSGTTQKDANGNATSSSSDTTRSNTTCDVNNVCSTTSTTSHADGTSTVTTTSSSRTVYCAANASSSLCSGTGSGTQPVSTFGGSCSAGFSCSGDAAMCAAARATWMTHCDLSANDPARDSALSSAMADSSGTLTTSTTAISSSSFDQTNALPTAAACIPDKTVNLTLLGGRTSSFTLKFSTVCPVLDQLGSLLMAVSFLMAMVIVFKG